MNFKTINFISLVEVLFLLDKIAKKNRKGKKNHTKSGFCIIRYDFLTEPPERVKFTRKPNPAGLRGSGVFLDPQINREERCLQPWYRVPRALDRDAAYSSWKKHSERGIYAPL